MADRLAAAVSSQDASRKARAAFWCTGPTGFFSGPVAWPGLFTISGTVSRRLEANSASGSTPLHPPAPARPIAATATATTSSWCRGSPRTSASPSSCAPSPKPPPRRSASSIAGDGPERAALGHLARELGVESRVTFLGEVSESELIDRYAACRAVAFTPFDEDYGFVTPEAFSAAKAVMTCRDSGGPTELVVHGESGFITEPTPAALAAALGRFVARRHGLAERLGQAGGRVAAVSCRGRRRRSASAASV